MVELGFNKVAYLLYKKNCTALRVAICLVCIEELKFHLSLPTLELFFIKFLLFDIKTEFSNFQVFSFIFTKKDVLLGNL